MKIYDVYEDGTATVSFYPRQFFLEAMGFKDVFEMNDAIEDATFDRYPELDDKKIAQFDPESGGTMVYCSSEDVAKTVESVFMEFIKVGLDVSRK